MIKKIIIILSLFINSLSFAQYVPRDWTGQEKNEEKLNIDRSLEKLSNNVNNLLAFKEDILKESEKDLEKGLISNWKISSQKTDFAISKSGLFGISALKGTSAVELTWVKRGRKEKSDSRYISLNTKMSQRTVNTKVLSIADVVLKRLTPSRRAKQKAIWKKQLEQYHSSLREVSRIRSHQYRPEKFRLDLSISYSAPAFGLQKLSADTRLRLEWKIKPVKTIRHNDDSRNQKVVRKILQDLDKVFAKAPNPTGYKLDKISIGLGVNKKNFLNFTKVKGEAIGLLFFKRVKKSTKNLQKSVKKIIKDNSYHWDDNNSHEKSIAIFKRGKFRKGLTKSITIGNWFSQKFKRRRNRWRISKFKTSFTLSYSGIFGLAGTGAKGIIEIYYKR